MVALSSRLQSVQRITSHLHSDLVTEGIVRAHQIVIDCFGDADHWQASFKKLVTQLQSPIPTHHKQAVQVKTFEIFDRLLRIILSRQLAVLAELTVFKRVAFIGGTKNGSSQRQYVPGSSHSEFSVPVKDQALEPLLNTYDFCPVADNRRPGDRPDHRIEAGAIPPPVRIPTRLRLMGISIYSIIFFTATTRRGADWQ